MLQVPVDECPAGPAMDAAVAEALGMKVQWQQWPDEIEPTYLACVYASEIDDWAEHKDWQRVLFYSTDIAAAWELIERADLLVDAVLTKNETGQYVICNKYHLYDWPFYYEGQDKNVALVICRAFLKANGIEYVEVPE